MSNSHLPVAVIGAGPVGLASATRLLANGEEPIVFEQGETVGAAVLGWGHVRLFSPWRYVIDDAAAELLAPTGWVSPDPESFPTGRELVERYLAPLARVPELRDRIRLGVRIESVTRDGFDKMKSDGRSDAPFLLTGETLDGRTEMWRVRAVIDASGTATMPNPLGASGRPVPGERELTDRIAYGIPDILGSDRDHYAGRRVLVVGNGHSAFNALLDLGRLADDAPGTTIVWAVRRPAQRLAGLFGGGANDQLSERGALGVRVEEMVARGQLQLVSGFKATRITDGDDGMLVAGEDTVLPAVDRVIVATGFRPDLSLLAELRIALDPIVESPVALAPLIDPNLHSCGSVPPHGAEELRHPEADVYVVGMKSYGRAPTFLMLTGYEQVRSVAAAIVGDWEAARDVRLVLPETGVCSTNLFDSPAASCCGSTVDEVTAATGTASCCAPATLASDGASGGSAGCCAPAAPRVIQLGGTRRVTAVVR